MNKFTTSLTLSFLIQSAVILNAHADRISHRPWMARSQDNTSNRMIKNTMQNLSTSKSARGDRIARQAIQYRGSRYRFGGTSKSKGFDCSGLIQKVYDDLKLKSLPRTSGQLYRMGNPIHLNELRPGDLVFFKNTYKRGISHVGVYAGSNRFVHAQNRRHGVTVSSMADPYYQLHYAGARRLY